MAHQLQCMLGKCCFFSGRLPKSWKTGLVNDLQQTTIGMKSEEEVQMFHKNIKYKESLTVFWPRVILQTSSRDRIVFQWFPFHIPEYCSTDYNIITTMQTISSWANLWIITASKQYSKQSYMNIYWRLFIENNLFLFDPFQLDIINRSS